MKRLVVDKISYYNDTISYRKLKNINAVFESGKIYSILSDGIMDALLLSMLAGMDKPIQGKLIYNETLLINDLDYHAYQKHMGLLVFREHLLENVKVKKNFELILPNYDIFDFAAVFKAFNEYKIDIGILEKKVKLLSDEEREDVLFILAIIHKPDIIIVNDVLKKTNLRAKLLCRLAKLCSDSATTILFLTHDRELSDYGDELWRFNDGRLNFVKMIKNK